MVNAMQRAWWPLLLAVLLWSCATLAMAAQVVGTVTQLSGPLMARKAGGAVKILALKSEVESGDTLITEKNTYAQLRFIDNSEITLKPATTFVIEHFAFDNGKQDADSASFSLVKGGLRSITGMLGKRSKEKFSLKTPAATIGIRGTTFIAEYIAPEDDTALALAGRRAWLDASTAALDGAAPVQALPPLAQGPVPPPSKSSGLAPGLYVQVIEGAIGLSNPVGSADFTSGQFGFTSDIRQPPMRLPGNPGLKFSTPPNFTRPSATAAPQAASTNDGSVDCIVR